MIINYDTHPDKGVDFGGEKLHTLGYVDDVALLDHAIKATTSRVTSIAQGSSEDTDMSINIAKTEVVTLPSKDEYHAQLQQKRRQCANSYAPT